MISGSADLFAICFPAKLIGALAGLISTFCYTFVTR